MRFLKSEAGAAVLWLLGMVVAAALLVPHLYEAGKEFALQYDPEKEGMMNSLAKSCGNADFARYFSRSLAISALALLSFLVWRLRVLGRRRGAAVVRKAPPAPWSARLLQLGLGLVLAGGLLWLMGAALDMAGAYVDRTKVPGPDKWLGKAVVPAIAASVIEEWLFRGLLLGVWLRVAKPVTAVLGVSLVFALVHFLEPPAGTEISNPAAADAGFRFLGLIARNFADPRFIAAEFATLFTVGLILAWTKLRTGSLWFPIGLHAGWIFSLKGFNLLHRSDPDSALRPLWIGSGLSSGLLPLLALLVTAVICHFLMRSRAVVPR